MTFAGLYFYEQILLICGCVFFLAITIILIVFAVQKRGLLSLLPFYVVPFLMIGFPAIQSVKISKSQIEIDKQTDLVDKDLDDSAKRAALQNAVNDIGWERAKQNPEICIQLANAKYVLGDYDSAMVYINYALEKMPESTQAKQLQAKIQAEANLQKEYNLAIKSMQIYLDSLKNNPQNDSTHYAELNKKIEEVQSKSPRYTSEKQVLVLAEAYAASRRTEDANKIIQSVKLKNPSSVAADSLKSNIESKKIESTYKIKTNQRIPIYNRTAIRLKPATVIVK